MAYGRRGTVKDNKILWIRFLEDKVHKLNRKIVTLEMDIRILQAKNLVLIEEIKKLK